MKDLKEIKLMLEELKKINPKLYDQLLAFVEGCLESDYHFAVFLQTEAFKPVNILLRTSEKYEHDSVFEEVYDIINEDEEDNDIVLDENGNEICLCEDCKKKLLEDGELVVEAPKDKKFYN